MGLPTAAKSGGSESWHTCDESGLHQGRLAYLKPNKQHRLPSREVVSWGMMLHIECMTCAVCFIHQQDLKTACTALYIESSVISFMPLHRARRAMVALRAVAAPTTVAERGAYLP